MRKECLKQAVRPLLEGKLPTDQIERILEDLTEEPGPSIEIFQVILDAGVSVLDKNGDGHNLLQIAVRNLCKPADIVKMLLSACDKSKLAELIDYKADDGKSALHYAVEYDKLQSTKEMYMTRLSVKPPLPVLKLFAPSGEHGFTSKRNMTLLQVLSYRDDQTFLKYANIFLEGAAQFPENTGPTSHERESLFGVIKNSYVSKHSTTVTALLRDAICYQAVLQSKMETAKKMMAQGADVHYSPLRNGILPIEMAVENKHFEMIELIMDNKCNINRVFRSNEFRWINAKHPLFEAVFIDFSTGKKLVDLLLKYDNVDIDFVIRGKTPFLVAVSVGNLDMAKCLAEHGANMETRFKFEEKKGGMNACVLHVATARKNNPCLKYLLSADSPHTFNVEDRCPYVGTPLMIAARQSNANNLLTILKHGADANTEDPSGATPLMSAVKNTLPDGWYSRLNKQKPNYTFMTILHLLRYGADVNKKVPLYKPESDDGDDDDDYRELPLTGIVERQELPLDVAIGHRMLPVAQMLWEAGSLQPQDVHWFKHSQGKHSCQGVFFIQKRKEMERFVGKTMSKPRSLVNWSRQAIRSNIPNITPEKVYSLQIPEHLKPYMNLSDLEEIYSKYCWEFGRRIKRYLEFNEWEQRIHESLWNDPNDIEDDILFNINPAEYPGYERHMEFILHEHTTPGLERIWDPCDHNKEWCISNLCDQLHSYKYRRPRLATDVEWDKKYIPR